jgi:DNA-binding transcriptional ArsR family regulator
MVMAGTAAPSGSFTIDRPEQLKALGHPLRLKILQALGDTGRPLTNRELAELIGVDPGHLHFHVRMLHKTGLIERAEGGRGREKPYRAVAAHLQVSPEFRSAGLATELNAAMLDEVKRGWHEFGSTADFRAGQLNVRLDPDVIRELFNELLERASALEDEREDQITVTVIVHPKAPPPPPEP